MKIRSRKKRVAWWCVVAVLVGQCAFADDRAQATLVEAESTGDTVGTWQKIPVAHPQCHGGHVNWHYGLEDPVTSVKHEFEGTSVSVIFQLSCRSGLVDVYVDGKKYGVKGGAFREFADGYTYFSGSFPEAKVWSPLSSELGRRHSLDTYDNDGWGVGQYIYREILISNNLGPGKHTLELVAANDSSYQGHDIKGEVGDGSFVQWKFRGASIVSVDAIRSGNFSFSSVSGMVYDNDPRVPDGVNEVLVTLTGPQKYEVYTGFDGGFSLSGLVAGRYTVTCVKPGRYQQKILKDIVIGEGKSVDLGHVVLEEDVDHPWYGKIFYPGRTNRAIRKVGEPLEIVFKAKQTTTVNRVVLSTAYNTYDVAISGQRYDAKSGGIVVSVATPDVPEEIYDLTLHTSIGRDTKHHVVKVIKDYKPDFYFIHWTDNQIRFEDGKWNENMAKLKETIRKIAFLDPAFSLVTGDNTIMDELNKPDRDRTLHGWFDALDTCDFPVYAVPGNHDAQSWGNSYMHHWYKAISGDSMDVSAVYGDCHLLGIDSAVEQFSDLEFYTPLRHEWIRDRLVEHQASALRLAFHHLCFYVPYRLFHEQKVDMVFFGHWGMDERFQLRSPGPPTGPPLRRLPMRSYEKEFAKLPLPDPLYPTWYTQCADNFHTELPFRLVRVKNGKITSSTDPELTNPWHVKTWERALHGLKNINFEFSPNNDGKNRTVACTIDNQLSESFEGGLVRFYMPKGSYQINSGNGDLYQTVDSDDGKTSICYVRLTYPAKSKIVISLGPKTSKGVQQ